MKDTISAYVQGCATCQANKTFPGNPKPPLFPIKTNPDALPFETIALDFIVKSSNQNQKAMTRSSLSPIMIVPKQPSLPYATKQ
jgi:hypothetical protein